MADFWTQAQSPSFYQPLQQANNQAITGFNLGAQQKQAQILQGAKIGQANLGGSLASQGLGRSSIQGGAGAGQMANFQQNVGNQIAGNQADLSGQVNNQNFQTQQYIQNQILQAQQNQQKYQVSPLGALGGIISGVTGIGKFAAANPLGL
jgi:hypothetical protein